MAKQLIPTKVYKDMANLLKKQGLIKEIPQLKWTTDKSCFGYLSYIEKKNRTTGWVEYQICGIYLNRTFCPNTLKNFLNNPNWSFKYFCELIDTIAHELAHITYHNHSEGHKELTKKYKELFYKNYGCMTTLNSVLNYIKDCKAE